MQTKSLPRSEYISAKLIVITLAVFINLIVAFNAVLHDPFVGYDADGHLDYMVTMALHLPTEAESGEYFSPPLPYFLPSLAFQACELDTITCKFIAGKLAQFINLLLSIFVTILLIKINDLASPGNRYLQISTLILLATLTVYYKTFTQVRGEPYLCFFATASIYFGMKLVFAGNSSPKPLDVLYLGVTLGGLALSRQWGFLLFLAYIWVALIILINNKKAGGRFSKSILLAFSIAFAVSSWFYFGLYHRFGSFTPFSTEARSFSFSNQPISFYRNLGISSFLLFRTPTRTTFDNQFIPLFYSDTWGDYWGYFTFIRGDPLYRHLGNKAEITPYLGRVNAVSILPSLIFAVSMVMGLIYTIKSLTKKSGNVESILVVLLFLMVSISLIGYLWFLIKYPLPRGLTIKATYMIQIYLALALLGGILLEKIRLQKHFLYKVILGLLAVVIAHNLPAMITRYWWFLR